MVDLQWPEDGSDAMQRAAVQAMLDWVSEGLPAPLFVLIPNPPTPVDRPKVRAAAGEARIVDIPAATFAVATPDRPRALECAMLLFTSLVDQLSIVAIDSPPPVSSAALGSWVEALLARPYRPATAPPLRGIVFDWGTPFEVLGPEGARVVDPKLTRRP